jgi:phospholipid-binding lipoprotein MlaA
MTTPTFFQSLSLAKTGALSLLAGILILGLGCSSGGRQGQLEPAPMDGGKVGSSGKAAADFDDWDDMEVEVVYDPIEAVNRATFWLNHGIYTVVVRPVADTYRFLLPKVVRDSVHNVYENVRFPVRFVNHLLQGKFDRAGLETGRFVVDSTLGVAGIFRASQSFPALAEVPRTDTGTTLARYGMPHGPYLVIPLIGPSSGREVLGLAGDTGLNPIFWTTFIFGADPWTLAITVPSTVRTLPDQMDQYDLITQDAADRYIAARNAYLQNRDARAQR